MGVFLSIAALPAVLVRESTAQPSPGVAAGGFHQNYHLGFDRPEAWGLKYFASATLLSGLSLPEPSEEERLGGISVGLELSSLPTLVV